MFRPGHPEVLAHDWTPPTPIARLPELQKLSGWLGDPFPPTPRPWGAAVLGAPGAGSSTVARLAARRLAEAMRRERLPAPLVAQVRVRWCRGAHGVATDLLQRLDEGFRGQGFPTAEVLAGFLRRLRRDVRPAIVLLDDLGPDVADLEPILRGLIHPERFLPEGDESMPPLWVLLAGAPASPATWERIRRGGFPVERVVHLAPYGRADLVAIVRDRAERALGRPCPHGWAERVADRALREGRGAARAVDLLRREILGPVADAPRSPFAPRGRPDDLRIEPRILRALERVALGRATSLGELREWEARLAREEGARPLPATTFWRRVVRLEAAGVVRREVRTGGAGGTRSMLELIRAPDGRGALSPPAGTRPSDATGRPGGGWAPPNPWGASRGPGPVPG